MPRGTFTGLPVDPRWGWTAISTSSPTKRRYVQYLAHILTCEMALLRQLVASNWCQAKFYLFLPARYTDNMQFDGSATDTYAGALLLAIKGIFGSASVENYSLNSVLQLSIPMRRKNNHTARDALN